MSRNAHAISEFDALGMAELFPMKARRISSSSSREVAKVMTSNVPALLPLVILRMSA